MARLCPFLVTTVSLCFQAIVAEWPSVLSAPSCYYYNKTECDNAKSSLSISMEDRLNVCSPRKTECIASGDSYAVCVAVWKQKRNDSSPHHTDNDFESTMYMSCFTNNNNKDSLCGAQCVSTVEGHDSPENDTVFVSCCCTDPYCNGHESRLLNITEPVSPFTDLSPRMTYCPSWLVVAIPIGIVITLALVLFIIFIKLKHSRLNRRELHHPLEDCVAEEDESLLIEDLNLGADIAQGRYAKVHLGGEINGVNVVIKCFSSANRRMWQQERDIYRSLGSNNNPNIARFFGAVQMNSSHGPSLWIVLQYYPHGSIYDYLKGHILTWSAMLKLAHSMIAGLAFLHDEIVSPDLGRRALAHRDIKSKNILIKDDMTAAIADFGLAQYFRSGDLLETDAQFQAGTHRYMAPEVLDGAISFTKDAFLRIDVYAAALVMWELLTRCDISETASLEYRAPFEDMEGGQYSTLLEMLQVLVSKQKRRPAFPSCLYRHRHAMTLITTIEESWDADAEARLSAGCIEARLKNLISVSVAGDTELNNMRNLDPPPYSQDLTVELSPLIPYSSSP